MCRDSRAGLTLVLFVIIRLIVLFINRHGVDVVASDFPQRCAGYPRDLPTRSKQVEDLGVG